MRPLPATVIARHGRLPPPGTRSAAARAAALAGARAARVHGVRLEDAARRAARVDVLGGAVGGDVGRAPEVGLDGDDVGACRGGQDSCRAHGNGHDAGDELAGESATPMLSSECLV